MKIETRAPVVLDRAHHPISRKKIDTDALKVLYRLHRHGFKAYLVGGAVRDYLLEKTPKDFDIATDARPGQIKKLFANAFLVGRRFRLAHIRFKGGKIIEVATFRREPDPAEDERKDSNNTFGTPHEDAFRRDITINGLFYDIATFSIIDYVGGLDDIARLRARIIGDPANRYTEDPVRIWRVLRHAARSNLTLEEGTESTIFSHRHLVATCSGARLFEELNKDMHSGFTGPLMGLMHHYGILPFILGDIGSFFEADSDSFTRLLSLLSALDASANAGGVLSQHERYSLLFWPWVKQILSDCNQRGADKIKILNDAFINTHMTVVVPKALRSNIIQTLIIVDYMLKAMETGRMRWSLKKRARYPDASRVYSLIVNGHILEGRDPFEKSFRRKYRTRTGRPRGGRNKKTNKRIDR
ncbi:MAG: polynucleotide adenylyltransferase PcnB [Deltaproteobacteria bacterium]|nr:polynucleotide adenylyltransferase PcnB [Deltaproteobacteria bacterium]